MFQKENRNISKEKNHKIKPFKINRPAYSRSRSSHSSLSSSSLNESLIIRKYIKSEENSMKQKSDIKSVDSHKDTNCYLNYESIFSNDKKRSIFLSNFKQSTPNNQSFSNDTSSSIFEKMCNSHKDNFDSKIGNNFEKQVYTQGFDKNCLNNKIYPSKKNSKDKPKTSR